MKYFLKVFNEIENRNSSKLKFYLVQLSKHIYETFKIDVVTFPYVIISVEFLFDSSL